MPFDGNVTINPITPLAPRGTNPPNTITKVADKPVVRDIPGITQYNPETGLVDEVGEFKDNKPGQPKVKTDKKKVKAEKPESEAEEKQSRHATWKQQQEEKKAQAAASKTQKAAAKQQLAIDLMRQGNFHQAAEAMNTTVPELLALMNRASLSLPTEEKKLTKEEQLLKDQEDYKNSVNAELEQHRKFRYETVATNWQNEHIAPVLADQKQYPLLNKEDTKKISRGVYEFINKHYQDTSVYNDKGEVIKEGEILPVDQILNTLEGQMEDFATRYLEQYKDLDKFKKYFTKQQMEEEQEEAEVEEVEEPTLEDEEVEDDNSATFSPKNVSFKNTTQTVPFALLSGPDKIKYLQEQRKKGKI